MRMIRSERNRYWISLINFIMITTFLCQNIAIADYNLSSYKLAPRSRWIAYGKSLNQGLNNKEIDALTIAIFRLENLLKDKTSYDREFLDVFNKNIDELNEYFAKIGCNLRIIANKYDIPMLSLPAKDGTTADFPYVMLNFGEKHDLSNQRIVLFNIKPEELTETGQNAIGFDKNKDSAWFELLDHERVWITGRGITIDYIKNQAFIKPTGGMNIGPTFTQEQPIGHKPKHPTQYISAAQGSALKDMGDEEPVEVPDEIKERWRLWANEEPDVREIEIKGLKIKANFQTAYSTMPIGMTAYHFYDNAGNLVIITRDKLGEQVVAEEAIYHEAREDYWELFFQKEGQDIVTARQIAHILAAAEEVMAFSEDGVSPYGITLYHIQQLSKMSINKLLRLSKEDRRRHHRLIRRYLGKSVLKKMIQYEKKIQIMAERLAGIIESDRGYNPVLGTATKETLWDVVSARLRMTSLDPDFNMEQWKINNPEKLKEIDAAIEGAVEDNKIINRQLYGISKTEAGIVDINNPKYSSLYREVRVIVDKLLSVKGYNPEDIELYISMDEEINAFVYKKSNKVFINIGLIRYFIENGGSVDSIAFVIAHELDHIDQWADDLISGNVATSANADERDADIRALRVINDAGYSVKGALEFFELLDKYEKSRRISAADKMLGVLAHPLTPTRIKYLKDMIIKLHWSSYFTENTYLSDEAKLQAYVPLADYRWRKNVELLNNVDNLVGVINEVRDISELFFVVVQGCESVFKSSDLENPDTSGFTRVKREFENKLLMLTLGNTGKIIFYNILAKCLYKIINISITRGIISNDERDNLPKDPEFVSLIQGLTYEQLMEIIEARVEFILPFKTAQDIGPFPKGYNQQLHYMYNYSFREVFIPHLVNNLSSGIQQGRITINDYLTRIMPELIRWRGQLEPYFHLNEYLVLDIDRMHTKLISQLLIRDAGSGYVMDVDDFIRLLDSWNENYFRLRDDNSIDLFLTEYLSHAPDSIKMAFTKWLLAKCKKEFTPIFIFKEDIVGAIVSNNFHELDPFFGANINERIENVYGSSFFNLHNNRRIGLILHLAKSVVINEDNRIFSDDAKEIQRLKIENYATVCTIAGKYGENVYREIIWRGHNVDSAVLDWELEQVGFIPPQIGGFNYSDPSLNSFKIGLLLLIKNGETGRVSILPDGNVVYHDYDSSRDRYFNNDTFRIYLSTLPPEVRRYTYEFLYLRIYDFLLARKDRPELSDVLKKVMQDEFKRIFGALAIDYIFYKHGRHQLDDSEFGSFISRVETLFRRYASKDVLERRRNNENDIALSINFLNRTQMSLNEILFLFPFIDNSPYSAEIILSDLCEHLLDSEYRNIAIYLTILKKKLIGEWGLDITESEYFNLDVVKAKIFSQLGESQKQELFGLLRSVGVNLVYDYFMSTENIILMESVREEVIQDPGKLTQSIREIHEREVESYPSVILEEYGGCLAQMGVFTSLLVEDELTKYIEDRERTFSEKRDCILQVFKYKSNTRDKFLLRLITDESNGEDAFPLKPEITSEDLYSLLNEFNNIGLRGIFALKALELEKVAKPYLFETLDGELNRIQYYFPKLSNNRDDIIKQVIDERVTRPEDLKKCEKLLLQHPDNIRNTDTADHNLGKDYYDMYVKSKDPAVKSGFLMWIVGLTDVKPDSMIYTEFQFKKKFDVLREMFRQRNKGYYKRFGQTNREEFLSSFLTGENGILSNATSKSIFLSALFDAVMPGQSNSIFKVIYDSVFKEADLDRQCEILLRLLDNLSNFNVKSIGTQEEKEAKAIRVFLESLGLIGVKLGQFIAGESDVQQAIRKELRELRDRAKSIEKGVIFDLIAKIYGNNAFNATDGIFSELGIELGSASIKVVYKAKLRDGRVVVVKVKRPEALKMIEAEILLLKKVIEDVKDKLRDNGIVVPENIVDRISRLIYDELNFNIERKNQKKLGCNLKKRLSLRNVPGLDRVFLKIMSKIMPSATRSYNIYIPQPVTIGGTDENNEVIIEEFAGVPLKKLRSKGFNDSQILDIKRSVVIEIFKQIFVDGFFHADPHMGNILVREPGDIAFIDVGVAQEIGLLSRWKFIQLIRGIKRSNLKMVKKFVNSFGVRADETTETRIINEVINSTDKFSNKIMRLFDIMHKAKIIIPQDILTLFRVFIVAGDLFDEAMNGNTSSNNEPQFAIRDGARRNITDTDITLTNDEQRVLKEYILKMSHIFYENKSYTLIEYNPNDDIGIIMARKGIAGAFNIEIDGQTFILIEEGLDDYDIALRHEELEIYWKRRLIKEGMPEQFARLSISRVAHILAWGQQIAELVSEGTWSTAENSKFIMKQLDRIKDNGKLLNKIIHGNRSIHKRLRKYYLGDIFDSEILTKITKFEQSVKDHAKRLLDQVDIEDQYTELQKRFSKDIDYAKILLNSLITSSFSEDRVYKIRYDKKRLSETQEAIIKEYIEILKKKVSNPNNIKVIPFTGTKRDYVVQIEYYNTQDQLLGKGQVNIEGKDIKTEGEDMLHNYPLQIVGMLNIALAGSHIVIGSSENGSLIKFIREQYKAITGKELGPDEDVRSIILPKPERMNLNEVDKLNRLSLGLLISA